MNLTVDMIIEGLRYVEVMMIQNSNVNCAGICVRIIFLIVYLPAELVRASLMTAINQRKVEKSPFEVSQRKIQFEN